MYPDTFDKDKYIRNYMVLGYFNVHHRIEHELPLAQTFPQTVLDCNLSFLDRLWVNRYWRPKPATHTAWIRSLVDVTVTNKRHLILLTVLKFTPPRFTSTTDANGEQRSAKKKTITDMQVVGTSPTYLTALLFVAVSFNVVASKDCTCYHTSTDDFFTSYIFHEFRNIPVPACGVPPYVTQLPGSADDKTGESDPPIGALQDGPISSRQWAKVWQIQSWGKGKNSDTKYRMWNSLSNVFIANNIDGDVNATSKLVLRTKRFPGFQSTAEVENMYPQLDHGWRVKANLEKRQNNLMYASTRIRARVVGNPGAVAGMFYYRNSQNESDIEILTRDENESVRYSNQPVVDKSIPSTFSSFLAQI
jgi:hypothetical protein